LEAAKLKLLRKQARRIRAVILTEQPVNDHLGPPAAASTPWTIFARVRLYVPKTAAEGGILRARGLVGGRCMHLHLYRDESRSGHFDLVGEGDHPWTIDLVTVTAAANLAVGFGGALVAHLVR